MTLSPSDSHAAPDPLSQKESLARDGFLILPGFVRAADCQRLMARAAELVAAFSPGPALSLFSTKEQSRTTDEYFLSSGDRIRFFFEPECIGPDGRLRVPKERAINKIGHALHDLDPVFSAFSRTPELAALAHFVEDAEEWSSE